MLDELSPELMEKAKACKSADELKALAAAEGVKLSDEELTALSGGGVEPDCPEYKTFNNFCAVYSTIDCPCDCTQVSISDVNGLFRCGQVTH